MLAETPQLFSHNEVLAIEVFVLLIVGGVICGVVVGGFVFARQAGAGSRGALVDWIVVLLLEALFLFGAVSLIMVGGHLIRLAWLLVPLGLIAAQVVRFLRARRDAASS